MFCLVADCEIGLSYLQAHYLQSNISLNFSLREAIALIALSLYARLQVFSFGSTLFLTALKYVLEVVTSEMNCLMRK